MKYSAWLHTAAAAGLSILSGCLWAQSWPGRPVHVIVPYAPGGGVDVVARVVVPYYARAWGQPVIVDNKPGAGGHVGAEMVAKSAPDGFALMMTASGQAAGPALYKKLNYDPVNDLVGIAGVVAAPNVLVVHPNVSAKTLAEFIALAKASPGKLNYGSTGVGSGPQLGFEMLKAMAGIDVVHVPYKGDGPLYPALLANEVQAGILPPQTAIPHMNTGRVKAIAVTSAARFRPLPDLPTFAEAGVPGYEYIAWVGVFAPAGTPRAILDRINADTQKTLADPEFTNKYLPQWGQEAMTLSASGFHARYLADIEKSKKIVRDARIPQID